MRDAPLQDAAGRRRGWDTGPWRRFSRPRDARDCGSAGSPENRPARPGGRPTRRHDGPRSAAPAFGTAGSGEDLAAALRLPVKLHRGNHVAGDGEEFLDGQLAVLEGCQRRQSLRLS